MKAANLNIRIDETTKEKSEKLFKKLGLNMTSAINLFLNASIRENGIPFDLRINQPNETTLKAIEEAKLIANDPSVKSYDNIDELKKALES